MWPWDNDLDVMTMLAMAQKKMKYIIGIDTNIEVIVVSLTTWEAHLRPMAVVSFPGR